ncbi:hypothetical protein GFL49_27270 [Rhizobium leguminosarum bv. viciae]|nr:hypothetical protein [Rhizobium leguminosarum bv. viciae]
MAKRWGKTKPFRADLPCILCKWALGRSIWAGRATPLCPAGHLPHKEGDWLGAMASPNKWPSYES